MSKLAGAEEGPSRCSSRPPTCTPSYCRPPFWCSLAHSLPRNGERGLKTLSDSRQRSDFSLGMAQGLGHKSCRIHIYQSGASFCPVEKEDPEWALQQTSPSWSALSGAAKRLSPQLFDCCPPATSHALQRTHTRSHVHTHTLHLALNILPRGGVQYPRTTSNGKPRSSFGAVMALPPKVAAPRSPGWVCVGDRPSPPVAKRQIENIPKIKFSSFL